MLEFNARTTELLEQAYLGADFTRRRRVSFDALRLEPGDCVLDIGCGNGLLTTDLARAVGAEGRVIGIDPSADMRAAAAQRCAPFANIDLMDGTAEALPVADGTADKAVSVQVFEYLEDLPAAVAGIHRALRPGGRLVVADMHFDTWAWASDDPDRMARMIASWDHHLTERCIPAILPPILSAAGFEVEHVSPVPFTDTHLAPDGMAMMLLHLMAPYAINNNHLTRQEVTAWAEEQHTRAAQGRFFFSITQFIISARKIATTSEPDTP